MVTKITILEPHFDGAQFGPATIESPVRPGTSDVAEDTEGDTENSDGSKSSAVTFLQGATVFVLMFGFLWVVLSRLFSGEDDQ